MVNALQIYEDAGHDPLLEYAANADRLNQMSAAELAGLFDRLSDSAINDIEMLESLEVNRF